MRGKIELHARPILDARTRSFAFLTMVVLIGRRGYDLSGLRSSLFALGKPQQPPPCLLSAGNISGRSSPPSTSARLPLRSRGITSRFAVGRASGRDDQRFPPLHRPIERLGKRPPRLAGEPCPAPLFWGVVRGKGRKGPSCGCHPMGHWVQRRMKGHGTKEGDQKSPPSL